jgi:hypothetical protein
MWNHRMRPGKMCRRGSAMSGRTRPPSEPADQMRLARQRPPISVPQSAVGKVARRACSDVQRLMTAWCPSGSHIPQSKPKSEQDIDVCSSQPSLVLRSHHPDENLIWVTITSECQGSRSGLGLQGSKPWTMSHDFSSCRLRLRGCSGANQNGPASLRSAGIKGDTQDYSRGER